MGMVAGYQPEVDAFQPLSKHIYQYIVDHSKLPDRSQSPKCLQPPPPHTHTQKKHQSGSLESVQQHLHLAYATTEASRGPDPADGSSISLPTNHPPLLLLPSLHIRQMRLTFTQLSTLQRREIYSASGRDWSQVST